MCLFMSKFSDKWSFLLKVPTNYNPFRDSNLIGFYGSEVYRPGPEFHLIMDMKRYCSSDAVRLVFDEKSLVTAIVLLVWELQDPFTSDWQFIIVGNLCFDAQIFVNKLDGSKNSHLKHSSSTSSCEEEVFYKFYDIVKSTRIFEWSLKGPIETHIYCNATILYPVFLGFVRDAFFCEELDRWLAIEEIETSKKS
jgi:hypothetical protein